jgi:hypothetical protein
MSQLDEYPEVRSSVIVLHEALIADLDELQGRLALAPVCGPPDNPHVSEVFVSGIEYALNEIITKHKRVEK